MKILKPISISESEPNNYGWMYAQSNTAVTRSGGMESDSPSLEPGEVKLTHTVYITYEIE